jgi:hypothetical protein
MNSILIPFHSKLQTNTLQTIETIALDLAIRLRYVLPKLARQSVQNSLTFLHSGLSRRSGKMLFDGRLIAVSHLAWEFPAKPSCGDVLA